MNSRFIVWATVLIASLVATGLSIRILAMRGVPLSESLFVRGLSCFVLLIIFARSRGLSLRPKRIKIQFFRALIAGLALSFFSMSYNWLTASAVSVLSNVDVRMLIVLGPLIGVRASIRTRFLALVSILFLVCYASGLEVQTHLFYGLASLMLGTVFLCFGYLFIKKSMNEENEAITILVPALALMVYGFFEWIIAPVATSTWTPALTSVGILSGLGMFGAYIATMRLYAITDLVSAEFPTLISSLVIQPAETIFLGEPLQFTYLLSSIGFVLVIYFMLKLQNFENANLPEVALAN